MSREHTVIQAPDTSLAFLFLNMLRKQSVLTSMPHLAHISLLVRDYDEAIAFYTRLGFELVEDTFIQDQNKRWVVIRPASDGGLDRSTATQSHTAATILLAQASNTEQASFVGNQTGGRVFLFLASDDFDRDYKHFSDAGIEWVRAPKVETYGKVAVWKDLYGNLWDLIQYH